MVRNLVLFTQADPTNGLPRNVLLINPWVFLLHTTVRQFLALIKWPLVEFKRVIGLWVLPHHGIHASICIHSRRIHGRYPLALYAFLNNRECRISPSKWILRGTRSLRMDWSQRSCLLWGVLSLLYGQGFDTESDSTKFEEITFLHLDMLQDMLLSVGPILNHGTCGNLPSLQIGQADDLPSLIKMVKVLVKLTTLSIKWLGMVNPIGVCFVDNGQHVLVVVRLLQSWYYLLHFYAVTG